MTIAVLFLGILLGAGGQLFLPSTWTFLVKLLLSGFLALILMIGLTFLNGGSLL